MEKPTAQRLSTNGLIMPGEFPSTAFEAIYQAVTGKITIGSALHAEFAGAWNAVSYRYLAMTEYEDAFSKSIVNAGASADPQERYQQERALFGFFGNGFSVFEATFYGLFALGALLQPTTFPIGTPKDQQAISPGRTRDAYSRAFPSDPILGAFGTLFDDGSFKEWREIRNVLTHRSAPGRTFYVTIEESEALPDEWKLLNIRLDGMTTKSRRLGLSGLLANLLAAAWSFADARLS